MPTIISGTDPWKTFQAYLAGYDRQSDVMEREKASQRRMVEQEKAAQASMREQEARHRFELQKAMIEEKRRQTEQAAQINQDAELGDAQAMSAQNALARGAGKPPEQQRLEDMMGAMQRLRTPEAREFALREIQNYTRELQSEAQKKAAGQVLERSAADGHMTPEQLQEAQLRMQSGEDPQNIAQEAVQMRAKRAQQAAAMADSTAAIKQAEDLVKASAPGTRSRKEALIILEAFRDSPTAQQEEDAGPKMLAQVKKALLLEASEQKAMKEKPVIGTGGMGLNEFKQMLEQLGQVPQSRLGAFTYDSPKTPGPLEEHQDYQTYKRQIAAEKEKRYPGSTKRKGQDLQRLVVEHLPDAKNSRDLLERLQKKGVKLTPSVVQEIKRIADALIAEADSGTPD